MNLGPNDMLKKNNKDDSSRFIDKMIWIFFGGLAPIVIIFVLIDALYDEAPSPVGEFIESAIYSGYQADKSISHNFVLKENGSLLSLWHGVGIRKIPLNMKPGQPSCLHYTKLAYKDGSSAFRLNDFKYGECQK